MPSKSRSQFEKLCDPSLAYWPDDMVSIRCRPARRNLYKTWVNELVNEILDPKCNEVNMEIESKKDPQMELDDKEIKSTIPKEEANCNKKIESNKQQSNENALQLAKATELNLRLNQFRPENITVTVKDNKLTVKGKLEKRTGTSYSCQSYEKTFTLPGDADQANILCSMDKNGLIKLNIPHKNLDQIEAKVIKINHESAESKQNEVISKTVEDDEPIVEDLIEE